VWSLKERLKGGSKISKMPTFVFQSRQGDDDLTYTDPTSPEGDLHFLHAALPLLQTVVLRSRILWFRTTERQQKHVRNGVTQRYMMQKQKLTSTV
jgi:hypothetical protein